MSKAAAGSGEALGLVSATGLLSVQGVGRLRYYTGAPRAPTWGRFSTCLSPRRHPRLLTARASRRCPTIPAPSAPSRPLRVVLLRRPLSAPYNHLMTTPPPIDPTLRVTFW